MAYRMPFKLFIHISIGRNERNHSAHNTLMPTFLQHLLFHPQLTYQLNSHQSEKYKRKKREKPLCIFRFSYLVLLIGSSSFWRFVVVVCRLQRLPTTSGRRYTPTYILHLFHNNCLIHTITPPHIPVIYRADLLLSTYLMCSKYFSKM